MKKRPNIRALLLLLATAIGLVGCAAEAPPAAPAETEAVQTNILEVEIMDFSHETENVIYLAGGCFWGLEQLMQSIPGVLDAESGYANGTGAQDANYSAVCAGDTGFRETVRVEYDPEEVSLDSLLLAYFYVIDPTVQNRQGNDIGTQYQTGVYYTNEAAKETVERIAELERMLTQMFAYFMAHVEKLPQPYYKLLESYEKEQVVCDYLSGMTDRYAITVFEELFIPSTFSIGGVK